MNHLSEVIDLTSKLEAISQTIAALSDAMENSANIILPRALFYPSLELMNIAAEIKKHLKEMEKEAETND